MLSSIEGGRSLGQLDIYQELPIASSVRQRAGMSGHIGHDTIRQHDLFFWKRWERGTLEVQMFRMNQRPHHYPLLSHALGTTKLTGRHPYPRLDHRNAAPHQFPALAYPISPLVCAARYGVGDI